ncbi:MAG: CDP-alcohol phosphatidyltransferase family protein [Acidobacteria bacterium]|nr:CDP-alcohol phosphatidyltransferase family protein [Acidobacteriota bacterium]MCL5289003.1 CDP-alcohol phosphatidyltransferase family protein [Acidobacteriota bacterium]
MTPNQITVLRVLAAFAAVALFGRSAYANLAAVGLTVAAIVLDAVDGWVARRKNLATPLGAQFDILGDRVVENLYFTYFAVCGLIPMWVPVLFFVRGTATDFVRGIAAREGRSGFGRNSMLESRWARALVASRASRAAYGVIKCVCFCAVGLQLAVASADAALLGALGELLPRIIAFVAQSLVWLTVAFCVLRGLPVLWEGRRYVAALNVPAVQTPRRAVTMPRRSAA